MPSSQDVAEAEDLLRLAIAEAEAAGIAGEQLVSASANPWMLSVAVHAIGIVLRDQGRTDEAVRELRRRAAGAVHSGDPDPRRGRRATLGIPGVGRTDPRRPPGAGPRGGGGGGPRSGPGA